MNEIFAVCKNPACALVFPLDRLIGGSGSVQISFTNTVTNCPRCGSDALINDGTYSYADNILSFLDGPPQTKAVLERVKAILESAKLQNEPQSAATLVDKVAQESPEVATLFQTFLTKLGKVDYKFSIAMLLAVLAILVSHCDSNSSSAQLDKLAYEQEIRDKTTQALLRQNIAAKEQSPYNGRNKPCSCGSGKKQRDCCKPLPRKGSSN
jgi:hypothetical protein